MISRITRKIATVAAVFAVVGGMAASRASADEMAGKVMMGGLLYDNWTKYTQNPPADTHPAYPESGKKKKTVTWRCTTCHGWDYAGKDGASAKDKLGIKGIRGAAGMEPAKVVALLKDNNHKYTEQMLSAEQMEALGAFVSKGQVDMSAVIDLQSKKAKGGDAAKGRGYYDTLCANCHGLDGKKISAMEAMGAIANKNPWEVLHKIRSGQPGENMPALLALPQDIAVDLLAYTQSMPE